MGKLNQKIGKTHSYPSFRKSYSTSCKGIVAIRKKKKFVKVKPQHWHFYIIQKRNNNIKAIKPGVVLSP